MSLHAAVVLSVGAIGIGVMAFAFFVGFAQSQHKQNAPNRRRESNDNAATHNRVRRPPMFCRDCNICRDRIETDQEVLNLFCGHRFHHFCLRAWMENSRVCPTCRCIAEIRHSS